MKNMLKGDVVIYSPKGVVGGSSRYIGIITGCSDDSPRLYNVKWWANGSYAGDTGTPCELQSDLTIIGTIFPYSHGEPKITLVDNPEDYR